VEIHPNSKAILSISEWVLIIHGLQASLRLFDKAFLIGTNELSTGITNPKNSPV